MKKYFPILAICLAVLLGATVYATSLKSEKSLVAQNYLLKDRKFTAPVAHRSVSAEKVTTQYNGMPYWCEALSYYTDGSFDFNDGPTRCFGMTIDINGDDATIYGLVDLYFDEVNVTYPVKGKYDSRRGTITISGTQYDHQKELNDYVKLAEMYSESLGEYSIVLLAGDFNRAGELDTIENLVFNVSEDLTTVTSTTGYGAYAFNSHGENLGFYDYYKASTIKKGSETLSVTTSTQDLTFDGLFVCTGSPVAEQFMIYNKGLDPVSFSLTCYSTDIECYPAVGAIPACSAFPVNVIFTPSHAGAFDETIFINIEGLDSPIGVKIVKDVIDRPDYMKIVQSGAEYITFGMDPLYPFVESEYDGHIAFMSSNEGKGNNTNSYFVCNLNVPKGKLAVFSWDAVQMESSPNCLTILLDGEYYMYDSTSNSDDPIDLSGNIVLSEGTHEVVFNNRVQLDWTIYGDKCRSYVWGLNLELTDSKPDNAYCHDDSHTFKSTFFDFLSVTSQEEVTVYNLGTNPLRVTEVVADENFSGIVPDISVPFGGEIAVPIIWTATKLGEDTGTVTIKTTGGDFAIQCSAEALPLPVDYSSIVKEGVFSFNTSVDYPFIMNATNSYAYNSSSKADINGITYSWIDASFEVEAGKVATIDWDAINDSEKMFEFMGTPSLVSGTVISIDGGDERSIGGQNIDCAAKDCYDKTQLTFGAGRHNVRFSYKKSLNTDDHVFGEDRLKLFELSLKTMDVGDLMSSISSKEAIFPNTVYCGCIGHLPLQLYNYTDQLPEIISVECDGPFGVKVKSVCRNNLLFNVEFFADKEGVYEAPLTIHTNIGDYTIFCKGQAKESSIGYALFYEGFEYDFTNEWILEDTNNDGFSWMPLSLGGDIFERYGGVSADGAEALMITCYDPVSDDFSDNFDDVAATPLIVIPTEGKTTLRFMERNYCYGIQTLEILVGDADDFSNYEVVQKYTFEDVVSDWMPFEVDLSAFAGKKVHVAFRAGEMGGVLMMIDDILIANDSATGVSGIASGRQILSTEYFSTDGTRLATPAEGISIEVKRFGDGTVTTRKITEKR